ncbi:transaldolase family protein [Rhizobium sp. NPDC090275]|uniref:transaldolase family protein n=1 Tax=Rhizobium sp. NPDC090275 TaxID=3364498 RepID=UPI003839EBAC
MKLYLDTADRLEIERHLGSGLFEGVTCNPAILKAAGLSAATARTFYECATGAGAKEVFIQVFGETSDAMMTQALRYIEYGPEVVIKIPGTLSGASVCRSLRERQVRVLMTAVHDAKQTVTAMAAHATYVTPYLSEMYQAGRDGIAQITSMQKMLSAAKTETRLLMAGLHDMPTLIKVAELGIGFLTITPKIADDLFREDATEKMVDFFNAVAA